MPRDRVDSLEERLEGLRRAADRLCEEHADVRGRLRALEASDEDAADGDPVPRDGIGNRSRRRRAPSGFPDGSTATGPGPEGEASEAEVAAAVRAVEERHDDGDDEGPDDNDILVA